MKILYACVISLLLAFTVTAGRLDNLPSIVADIESHLPQAHPYRDSDYITYVHEGTHGINSDLRTRYKKPGFYALRNRAFLLKEPNTTLSIVARSVPVSLRGDVYSLYLVQAQQWWNNQPTYVFDEWVAYTNGAQARYELGITSHKETVQYSFEFLVYSACMIQASKSEDQQLKSFFKWQAERTMLIKHLSGIQTDYLASLRTNKDAVQLRQFLQTYCGSDWTKKILGF